MTTTGSASIGSASSQTPPARPAPADKRQGFYNHIAAFNRWHDEHVGVAGYRRVDPLDSGRFDADRVVHCQGAVNEQPLEASLHGQRGNFCRIDR